MALHLVQPDFPSLRLRVSGLMENLKEMLDDAKTHLNKAVELLSEGNWQRGIFDLGCASTRIFQVVEWLQEHVGDKPPSYHT